MCDFLVRQLIVKLHGRLLNVLKVIIFKAVEISIANVIYTLGAGNRRLVVLVPLVRLLLLNQVFVEDEELLELLFSLELGEKFLSVRSCLRASSGAYVGLDLYPILAEKLQALQELQMFLLSPLSALKPAALSLALVRHVS